MCASPVIATAIKSRRANAMGMMVVSSVAISFSGLLLRYMHVADPWQINFYRSIALVIVVSMIMVQRYGRTAPQQVYRIGKPGLWAGLMLSGAGITFLQSITTTTVANTLFTLSAIPFFTAALAWVFLKERLNRATLVTMLVAALGIVVMVSGGIGSGSFYGNAMALITALCFSGYAILVRRHRGIEMLPTLLVSGAIIISISAVLRWGQLVIPLHDIALCFVIGGILSALCNSLFIAASKHLVAAELTLFMLLEFSLGPIWVWLFIAEYPSSATIIGGSIVISAVLLRAVGELSRGRIPGTRHTGKFWRAPH